MKRFPWVFAAAPLIASAVLVAGQPAPATVEVPPPVVVPAEVEATDPILLYRSMARELVTQDLIAGRTSPVEAAAIFRALNALPPQRRHSAGPLPDTDEGRACWEVIDSVRYTLESDENTEEAECVAAGLEAEFRAGALRLPDLPPTAAEDLFDQVRDGLARERADNTSRAFWLPERTMTRPH